MKNGNFLTSGCLLLDLMITGKPNCCYEFGKIHNLLGVESGGKSLLSLIACGIAKRQFDDIAIVYDDSERAVNFDFAQLCFPEILDASEDISSDVSYVTSETIEEFFENLQKLSSLRKERAIYILDSYDALWSKDTKEDGYYLEKTRKLSVLAGKIASLCRNNNILLVIINQVREEVGSLVRSLRVSGGRSVRHYSSLRLQLHPDQKFTKKAHGTEIVYMQMFQFQVLKSRFGKPFRKGSFYVNFYSAKIDNELTNINYLLQVGKFKKDKSGRIEFDGKKLFPVELANYIRHNNKQEELAKLVIETFYEEEKKLEEVCSF